MSRKPVVEWAWALWIPRYRTYAPATKLKYEPRVMLFASRRKAKAYQLPGHSMVVRVKIVPVT